LLVDVDLRNPKLHLPFNLDPNLAPHGGLTGFLLDNLPLKSCLSETGVRNLSLIASSNRAARRRVEPREKPLVLSDGRLRAGSQWSGTQGRTAASGRSERK
jgi:Mrp family chromosome partitioning ATPase